MIITTKSNGKSAVYVGLSVKKELLDSQPARQ